MSSNINLEYKSKGKSYTGKLIGHTISITLLLFSTWKLLNEINNGKIGNELFIVIGIVIGIELIILGIDLFKVLTGKKKYAWAKITDDYIRCKNFEDRKPLKMNRNDIDQIRYGYTHKIIIVSSKEGPDMYLDLTYLGEDDFSTAKNVLDNYVLKLTPST
jgi:hypothetical protein